MGSNGSETHGISRTEVDRDRKIILDFWCTLRYTLIMLQNNSIKGEHLVKSVDTTAFSTYTPESAYWAGFIAADGCITGGYLKICLHYQDIDHLEKFKQFVKSTHKISSNTEKYNRAEIGFKLSDQMKDDLLLNYNIGPNKSLTYEMPILPKECFWPFVRGYFDGDGCICESFSNKNSRKATLYTTIVGSKLLIPELYELIGIRGSIQEKSTTKTIKYCTNSSLELLETLYDSETVYLNRKYNLYQDILTQGIKTR